MWKVNEAQRSWGTLPGSQGGWIPTGIGLGPESPLTLTSCVFCGEQVPQEAVAGCSRVKMLAPWKRQAASLAALEGAWWCWGEWREGSATEGPFALPKRLWAPDILGSVAYKSHQNTLTLTFLEPRGHFSLLWGQPLWHSQPGSRCM